MAKRKTPKKRKRKRKLICEACGGIRLKVISETSFVEQEEVKIRKIYRCPRCGDGFDQVFDRQCPG